MPKLKHIQLPFKITISVLFSNCTVVINRVMNTEIMHWLLYSGVSEKASSVHEDLVKNVIRGNIMICRHAYPQCEYHGFVCVLANKSGSYYTSNTLLNCVLNYGYLALDTSISTWSTLISEFLVAMEAGTLWMWSWTKILKYSIIQCRKFLKLLMCPLVYVLTTLQ